MARHEGILDLELLLENADTSYQPASLFKRLLNLIIDYLTIIHFAVFVGLLLGVFFTLIGKPELVSGETSIFKNDFYKITVSASVIFFYYFLAEFWLNGKTLGKFATQTSVKNTSGKTASFRNIFIRSLLRLIPVDLVTFLFGKNMGWHDYFSKTVVVEDE